MIGEIPQWNTVSDYAVFVSIIIPKVKSKNRQQQLNKKRKRERKSIFPLLSLMKNKIGT